MARDIFISHSARDRAVADELCAALEAAGHRCWVAPRNVRPGHSFAGEITRAIRQSKVMVLIFSGHSNKSEQVLREVQLATDCRLSIVRFRIEDVALTDDLTYFLSTPHWLDALTPPLSKHIASLEMAVKELLGLSSDDPGRGVADGKVPLEKSTQKAEPKVAAQTASNRWKILFIAAAVLVAVVGVVALLRRPASPAAQTREAMSNASPPAAQTPSSTPGITQTRTAENTGKNDENIAGPSRRNNRWWNAWLDDFVHRYVQSSELNDTNLAASFFAPTVDLFDEGLKPLDFIRRDIATYNARWPVRRATIRGDVKLSEKTPDRGYAASFEADYYVESAERGEWTNLAVLVELQIIVLDGLPRINSLKQKRLRKEEGKMQSKAAAIAENLSTTSLVTPVASSTPIALTTVSPTSPPPGALSSMAEGDPRLIRVANTRYGFSAVIPQNVFPNPQTIFSTDRQTFSSYDGQTTLAFFVQRNNSPKRLQENYEQWAAQYTQAEPAKIVDYKVLRRDWFVVSGEKSGRGFYVKAIAKGDILVFMYFECDQYNYPVNKATLTVMSRSFDGK